MSRIIKFRAWDKITRRWLNDYNDLWLNLEGKVFFMTTTGGYEGHDYLKKLDAEVCLYTGLKDKNGIEIYEGDIVKAGKDPKVCKVIFENGCFYTPYNESKYRIGGWINKTLEVIGNIYEHKNLLDGEQVSK